MAEERKLATILFADIVGSTAAGAAHDPEVVRRTLSRAFAEMRQVLEAHGGTVEKFIGDAVMCVFGVPAAHDDDADRAVRAAFALRERVRELNASGRIPLELRIGVNTGQVVAGIGAETLVTGGPVNEAARLQQAAGASEILVGALTHRLTAAGVRYGDARRVAAKGVGEITAYPVVALTAVVPEQHRGVEGLHAPLVGRDDELRLLVDGFRKTASEKRAALVTIFGSAGVGKSRLVREFVDAIGSTAVRRGRCLPYGQGITFWPVVEMLRADARITATDTLEQARSSLRTAVFAAFGDATSEADAMARRLSVLAEIASPEEALPEVAGDQLQQELRLAFRRYLERRAQREPAVLVFDDIHWAEPPLLDLIEHIAEWSRAPLFVVCLARPELRDRRKGWGGGLMNASAIALEPLTAEESRRLVADLLDVDDLPETLRAEVVGRAEGNPLYIEEFLRMLIDTGHITRRASRWVAGARVSELVVPPTLQSLIAARLDQAPPNVKRTLQRAAVVGKVFWTNAAAALVGEESVDDALVEAARRDIVLELDERGLGGGAAFQFRHILIRDVAYDSIPKEERSRLHDAFSRWLERAAGERLEEYGDIVAYHAEQAFGYADEIGEPSASELGLRAFGLLMHAGRRAWQRKDLRAVRSYYERSGRVGLRVAVDPRDQAEAVVYAAMGHIAEETTPGAIDELQKAVAVARGAGPSVALVDGLLWLWFVTLTSGESITDSIPLLDEAIEVARASGDHQAIAGALLFRGGLYWWRGDLAGHRRQLEEALAYAREHGVRAAVVEILPELELGAFTAGEIRRARELHDEFASLASSSGSLITRRWLLRSAMRIAVEEDHPETAVASAKEQIEISERIGLREWIARSHEALGDVHYALGDGAASRDDLLEAMRWLDRQAMRGGLPEAQWKLSRAYLALGDVANARAQAEAGRASVIPTDVYSVATTTAALAAVCSREGRADEAERLYREAVATVAPTGYRLLAAEIAIGLADHLTRVGRIDEARQVLRQAREAVGDELAIRTRRLIDERLRKLEVASAR